MKIWTQQEEAERLTARFAESKVTQKAFAEAFGVKGGAAMIYQHTRGLRPMNLEAATAYARGFGVALEEISPRLAALAAESNTVLSAEGAAAAKERSEEKQSLPPNVQAVVDMMMRTDDEGRMRIKIGVSDILFNYNKLQQERKYALGILPADLIENLAQITDPAAIEQIRGVLLTLDIPQQQRAAK